MVLFVIMIHWLGLVCLKNSSESLKIVRTISSVRRNFYLKNAVAASALGAPAASTAMAEANECTHGRLAWRSYSTARRRWGWEINFGKIPLSASCPRRPALHTHCSSRHSHAAHAIGSCGWASRSLAISSQQLADSHTCLFSQKLFFFLSKHGEVKT